MKYILPSVPDITIINKNNKSFLINYIYEFNTITLSDNSKIIIIETPISDTELDDVLNYSDIYNFQCEFKARNMKDTLIESNFKTMKNMKLIRKDERYTSEIKSEENVYIFYNGNKNIDKAIETILFDKKKEQLKKEIKQELFKELIK